MKFKTLLTLIFFSISISFAQIKTSEISYSIEVDKAIYTTTDTIYWQAKMVNLTSDTLQFQSLHGVPEFFEWFMIDSSGTYWNGFVSIGSTITFTIPPFDSLTHQWKTPISYTSFSFPPNLYYGLMKPYYNYDSLAHDTVTFEITETTGIDDLPVQISQDFELFKLYPNPFNPLTTIEFTISRSSNIDLSVYDVTGQKVKTLINGKIKEGKSSLIWDASDLSTGIYLIRITNGLYIKTRKAVLLR